MASSADIPATFHPAPLQPAQGQQQQAAPRGRPDAPGAAPARWGHLGSEPHSTRQIPLTTPHLPLASARHPPKKWHLPRPPPTPFPKLLKPPSPPAPGHQLPLTPDCRPRARPSPSARPNLPAPDTRTPLHARRAHTASRRTRAAPAYFFSPSKSKKDSKAGGAFILPPQPPTRPLPPPPPPPDATTQPLPGHAASRPRRFGTGSLPPGDAEELAQAASADSAHAPSGSHAPAPAGRLAGRGLLGSCNPVVCRDVRLKTQRRVWTALSGHPARQLQVPGQVGTGAT